MNGCKFVSIHLVAIYNLAFDSNAAPEDAGLFSLTENVPPGSEILMHPRPQHVDSACDLDAKLRERGTGRLRGTHAQ